MIRPPVRPLPPGLIAPPANWNRVVAMDYADAGWKASLFAAIEPWQRFAVVYSSWKERSREISEQVHEAKRRLGPRADDPQTTWIVDKSAPLLEYIKNGAPVIPSMSGPGKKAWLISQANELLYTDRLFVIADECEPFLWEARRFVRKPESDRPGSDERKPGQVVKRDDHLCDCFLYLCGYLSGVLSDERQPRTPEPKRPWPPPPLTRAERKKLYRPDDQGLDALLSDLNQGLLGSDGPW